MENLQRVAESRARQRAGMVAARIGERLNQELPARLRVESSFSEVTVSGLNLRAELLRNPDLRAIGYVMRAVR